MTDLVQSFVDFMNGTPSLPLGLVLFVATAPLVAFLHECGHALAASYRVGEAWIKIKIVPDPRRPQGLCVYDASRATRADTVIIALAGPVASALGAFLAWALYSNAAATGLWHDVCSILLLSNVGAVVLNLLPLRLTDGRKEGAAVLLLDGRVVLDALRGSPSEPASPRDWA